MAGRAEQALQKDTGSRPSVNGWTLKVLRQCQMLSCGHAPADDRSAQIWLQNSYLRPFQPVEHSLKKGALIGNSASSLGPPSDKLFASQPTTDGKMLRHVTQPNNTANDAWANTAYRAKANEAWLSRGMGTHSIKLRP